MNIKKGNSINCKTIFIDDGDKIKVAGLPPIVHKLLFKNQFSQIVLYPVYELVIHLLLWK